MWLEVEVGPRLFVPPEDDSYSVDFVMEVMNRAYPGCTGMYLDRAGHMLAFMVEKVARGPASFKMLRSRPAKLWVNFPHGWDTPPGGELYASASQRLMKSWLDARGWRKRTGGENGCNCKNGLPLCTSLATSQLMPFLSSRRLHCQPLGWLVWPEVFQNGREMGPHLTFPHLVEPQVLH